MKDGCFDSFDDLLADALAFGITPDEKKKQKTSGKKSGDPALDNFHAVIAFVEANGREPDSDNPDERKLANILKGERKRPDLREKLLPHDRLGLLKQDQEPFSLTVEAPPPVPEKTDAFDSLDDMLNDEEVRSLLGGIDSSILDMNHVQRAEEQERMRPDEIASRKPCADFADFAKLFADKQRQIEKGIAKTARFTSTEQIAPGQFYILRGIVCYIDKVLKESAENYERDNPRLRVIFGNGTESNMLKRSLARKLYQDEHGRAIIQTAEEMTSLMEKAEPYLSAKDQSKGWIYILKTRSTSPSLALYRDTGHLVKIGFTTQTVEERIAHAEEEPTYLMAPVEVLAQFECFNMNVHQFEKFIHAFLYEVRLPLKVKTKTGKTVEAREWFRIDVQTAIEVCQHIVKGDIHKYRMDAVNGILVGR